jgi:phage shock protein C
MVMTSHDRCAGTVGALRAAVERGQPPAPEQAAHWQGCAACQALVTAASRHLAALSESLERADAADEAGAAERVRKASARAIEAGWRNELRAAAVQALVIVLGCVGAGFLVGGLPDDWRWEMSFSVFMLSVLTSALVFGALALSRLPRRMGLYKRLKPGCWIEGVCLGLAERFGLSVSLVRLGFVLFSLWRSEGVLIYVMLAFLMPVHPEDRRYLFTFRVARWWRKVRGLEEAEARS